MQMFVLVFILVCVILLAFLRWIRNENAPVHRVSATIIHMRRKKHLRTHHRSYHVTFLAENGEQIELRVEYDEYDTMAVGDKGTLTYQGTRYQGFKR